MHVHSCILQALKLTFETTVYYHILE